MTLKPTEEQVKAAEELSVPCKYCEGHGWTTEHASTPHVDGCDGDCPVQEQCSYCHATGKTVPADSVASLLATREAEAEKRGRMSVHDDYSNNCACGCWDEFNKSQAAEGGGV